VQIYPIEFDRNAPNPFLCPSTVAYVDGRFFFGAEAEHRTDAVRLWRHLKVCVACEAEQTIGSANCACALAGRQNETATHFSALDFDLSPVELTVLYLSWVLGAVHDRLPRSLTGSAEPVLTCNLGVPVDQIDSPSPLHIAYARIALCAWRLRGNVEQGISVTTALGWLSSLRSGTVNDDDDFPVVLCPETGAAVVSQLTVPTMPEGMYALVDIGAWTTDISFFRLTDVSIFAEGVRTTAFYEAATHRVAAGRIDLVATELIHRHQQALKSVAVFRDDTDALQEACRNSREAETPAKESGRAIEDHALRSALDFARCVVAGEVKSHYETTASKARLKESPLSRDDWKDLTVLLLGGGSEEDCFEAALKQSSTARSVTKLKHDPRLDGTDTRPGDAARSRRQQVAAGLAIPAALWPKRFLPSAVERVTVSRPAKKRPDRDELYPK